MLNLISLDKYKVILNPSTGKWIGFVDENINLNKAENVTLDDIEKIFANNKNYNKILNSVKRISKKTPLKNDLLKNLNYLVLHTTDQCNMSCLYCYAEDNIAKCNTKANLMSAQTMIDAINKFYNGGDFYVLFHGREPLINWKNIQKTIQHFKQNNNLHFILQTNGLLLNEKIIEQLNENNVQINVSVDGFDDEANQLRINGKCFNFTNHVVSLLKNHKEISPILIIHNKNIHKIKDITAKLKSMGHTNVAYNFLYPTAENPHLDNLVPDNDELFEVLKDVFEQSINEEYEFDFIERDLYLLYGRVAFNHINNYMCNKSPCGAGKVCICVNYDGDVYPCTTVKGQKENFMGNIYKNSTKEILNHDYVLKHRDINQIQQCNDCPYKIFCGGGSCSGLIYNYKKEINAGSIYCKYYKNMISFFMKKCIDLSNDFFEN